MKLIVYVTILNVKDVGNIMTKMILNLMKKITIKKKNASIVTKNLMVIILF